MSTHRTHPATVLKRFYTAEREYMQAGGREMGASFDGMAATLAADVVLHHSLDLPWGGDWHGRDGFEGWSTKMSELNESVEVQDPRFFTDGDTVVASLTLVTVARETGTRIEAPMIQQVTVSGDQITDFRAFYWNVPEYLRAYGLPAPRG